MVGGVERVEAGRSIVGFTQQGGRPASIGEVPFPLRGGRRVAVALDEQFQIMASGCACQPRAERTGEAVKGIALRMVIRDVGAVDDVVNRHAHRVEGAGGVSPLPGAADALGASIRVGAEPGRRPQFDVQTIALEQVAPAGALRPVTDPGAEGDPRGQIRLERTTAVGAKASKRGKEGPESERGK